MLEISDVNIIFKFLHYKKKIIYLPPPNQLQFRYVEDDHCQYRVVDLTGGYLQCLEFLCQSQQSQKTFVYSCASPMDDLQCLQLHLGSMSLPPPTFFVIILIVRRPKNVLNRYYTGNINRLPAESI